MKKLIINMSSLLILATAVFLSGCGGSSDDVVVVSDDSEAFKIVFDGQDIAWDIDEVVVKSGQEITVEFNNVGELEHNWILTTDDIRPRNATEADALPGTNSGILVGGQSKTFTFTAPEPGSYKFVCTIEGHAFAGMVGDFTVE